MTHSEFTQRTRGFIHHHAKVQLKDGTTKEGYMQPFDAHKVYFTTLEGLSGGSVEIADVVSIDFPND